jgi:hypothetical protein
MENVVKFLIFAPIFIGCANFQPLIEDLIQNNPGVLVTEEKEKKEIPPLIVAKEIKEVEEEPSPPVKVKKPKKEEVKPSISQKQKCYNVGEHTECCVTETPTDCCDSRFGDGLGGLLYKLGDHSGEPVILTPGTCGHVESVELVGPNGTIKARNAGMSNPDVGGICRDHHRFDIKASDLAKKLGTTKPRIRVSASCFIETLKKGVKKRHD